MKKMNVSLQFPISQRIDDHQKRLLIKYIENHHELLQINIHNANYSINSRMAWEKLAEYINKQGNAKKSAMKWKKTWQDFKTVLKGKRRRRREEGMMKSPNGRDPFRATITKMENKILDLIEFEESHGESPQEFTVKTNYVRVNLYF